MDELQNGADEAPSVDANAQAGMDQNASGSDESGSQSDAASLAMENDPQSIKKRLGMQAKRHARDLRAMQEQISQLQSQVSPQQSMGNNMGGYPQQPQGQQMDDPIQRAVQFALQARDDQERKQKDAQNLAHVQKQYQRLNGEFDKASDKYSDFDDVVRDDGAPFTSTIRDALLLVDNPADVAYKLGKNRDELARISQLHPVDQTREVNKLSFALMGGGNAGSPSSAQGASTSRPMGQIKATPVTSNANQSAASIRARMKAGTWK